MPHRLALALLGLGLLGCQAGNPYTAESRPIPAAPDTTSQAGDLSGYPGERPDFSRYRSWSWHQPPSGSASLDADALRDMVSGALDQRGLRPARGDATGDLQVAVQVRRDTRTRLVQDPVGLHYGYGRGHSPYYGAWGTPAPMHTREEEVMAVQIQLLDGATGRPLWSNQAQAVVDGERTARQDAVREALRQALEDWPPH